MAPTSIDGTEITGATIDGQDVSEITVDGETVFTAIPDSGVLRYRFEQNLIDDFGTNNGTDNTSAGYRTLSAEGSFAKSYDGVDDFITYPNLNVTSPSTSWTVAIFVILDSIPSSADAFIWHPRAEFDMNISVDEGLSNDGLSTVRGQVVFQTFDGSTSTLKSGVTLTTGEYYLIGASNDGGGNYTVRVDSEKNTGALPSANSTSSSNFVGGRVLDNGPQNLLDGGTDDFRIYDKELSDVEWDNLLTTGSIDG